jgi:hypothetical protein
MLLRPTSRPIRLLFPDTLLVQRRAARVGRRRVLGERMRSERSLMWDIGDWWNRSEAYGERARVVTGGDRTGPTRGTCENAGSVGRRWDVSLRNDTLGFNHHQIVAALDNERGCTPSSDSAGYCGRLRRCSDLPGGAAWAAASMPRWCARILAPARCRSCRGIAGAPPRQRKTRRHVRRQHGSRWPRPR